MKTVHDHDAPRSATGERPFDITEMFYSTTDAKGQITGCNDVFVRISDYERGDLIGAPHNVIRHPDMPRGAFRLVWDRLLAGEPVAAYVKNRARNGDHYWVLGYMTPIDGGYLSVRIKPTSTHFETARAIYADALAWEQANDTGPSGRAALIIDSRDRIIATIEAAGFADYEAFMRDAMQTECAARADSMRETQRTIGNLYDAPSHPVVEQARDLLHVMSRHIEHDVRESVEKVGQLEGQRDMVEAMATDIDLFSLNAQIGATRLGANGAPLLVIAQLLNRYGNDARPAIAALADEITACEASLRRARDMSFAATVNELQLEMVASFLAERAAGTTGSSDADDIARLVGAVQAITRQLVSFLHDVHERMTQLAARVAGVIAIIQRLRALEINGRVESARLSGAQHVEQLFLAIGQLVRAAEEELSTTSITTSYDERAPHRLLQLMDELDALRADTALETCRAAPALAA